MANVKDYLLPDLGEGLTEGEIVQWLVAVGDSVEVDQPVAEVETAKAVVEVPSPFAGTVTTLHAEVGDEVEVGKPLITIDVHAMPNGSAQATANGSADGGAVDADRPAEPEQAASEPGGTVGGTSKEAEAGEMVPSPADEVDSGGGDSGSVLVGYGTGAAARSRRRRGAGKGPAAGAPPARPASAGPTRPLAKPPVRKLAKDLGVDLAQVPGSGPEGVVTREDVHAHAGNGQTAQPVATPQPTAPGELTERIPVKGVRKAVAQKMTISRREIPEATSWVDCDATRLWDLRSELNAGQSEVKVSALAIIMRACVAGLRRFPDVNARLDTETNEIVLQHFVNLGFAAQTPSGLMVPVIHRADQRSTLEIAAELNRLAAAARDRSVKPEELAGGTFTLSNYGSFGVDGGSAVINHPEAAILGIGRISDRPWVHDGVVKPRKVMQLSIAFDHRICDGGEAAGFLRFIADCVESPGMLLANL